MNKFSFWILLLSLRECLQSYKPIIITEVSCVISRTFMHSGVDETHFINRTPACHGGSVLTMESHKEEVIQFGYSDVALDICVLAGE